jgi:hypothetical protein
MGKAQSIQDTDDAIGYNCSLSPLAARRAAGLQLCTAVSTPRRRAGPMPDPTSRPLLLSQRRLKVRRAGVT